MRAQFVQARDSLLLRRLASAAWIGATGAHRALTAASTSAAAHRAIPGPSQGISMKLELPLNGRMSLQHDSPGRYFRSEKSTYFQNKPMPPASSAMAAESVLPARKPDRTCPCHLTVSLRDPQVVKDKRPVV